MSNIIELSAIRKALGGDVVATDFTKQKSLVEQIAQVIGDLERASRRIHGLIAHIVDDDARKKHLADARSIDAQIGTARVRFEAALNCFLELNATLRAN